MNAKEAKEYLAQHPSKQEAWKAKQYEDFLEFTQAAAPLLKIIEKLRNRLGHASHCAERDPEMPEPCTCGIFDLDNESLQVEREYREKHLGL